MPSRLTLALENALLVLPETGLIGFLNASAISDFGRLETGRIIASQRFYPDFEMLERRGVNITPTLEDRCAVTHVTCHRSKLATLDLIAQAAALTEVGGKVIIDGDKTDGIESISKDLRRRLDLDGSYSKSHGKLLWFTIPAGKLDFDDWTAKPNQLPDGFTTFPGIFSAEKIDIGSVLLANNIPPLKGKVADAGAGWGYLSRAVLSSSDVTALDLIEADAEAVRAARLNITDTRAQFHWADVTSFEQRGYDAVVSNPPFHTSRTADPAVGQAFIRSAARMIKPSGSFWMVANRNLPYEETLQTCFGNTHIVTQEQGFKIIHARKPKTSRTR